MSDPVNLLQVVRDALLTAYRSGSARNGQLAFERIGVPITADMFKVNASDTALSPALAVEELAALANTAPHLEDGVFERSMRTLDGAYELMLGAASPVAAADTEAVGRVRSAAQLAYGEPLGSLQAGGADYRPVTAFPADWYEPKQTGWTSYSSATAASTQTTVQTGPTPPPLRWRVLGPRYTPMLEARRALFADRAELPQSGQSGLGFHPGREPMMMARAPMRAQSLGQTLLRAAVAVAPAVLQPAAIEPVTQIIRPMLATQTIATIAASATQQTVNSSDVVISFDYCLVLVSRPWLSEAFLEARGWFVPGYGAGELSSGNDLAGDGVFGLVPTAFVAIRNLSVHGTWTHDDQTAITTSASLGPFSLFGRSFDAVTGTLTCPGMQILAWICETQPALPPAADPALAAAAPAAAVTVPA